MCTLSHALAPRNGGDPNSSDNYGGSENNDSVIDDHDGSGGDYDGGNHDNGDSDKLPMFTRHN